MLMVSALGIVMLVFGLAFANFVIDLEFRQPIPKAMALQMAEKSAQDGLEYGAMIAMKDLPALIVEVQAGPRTLIGARCLPGPCKKYNTVPVNIVRAEATEHDDEVLIVSTACVPNTSATCVSTGWRSEAIVKVYGHVKDLKSQPCETGWC